MESADIVTRDYTGVSTAQIVEEMLKENTGRGLCDSGDFYGRNWSTNATRDLAARPATTCTWDIYRHKGESRIEPNFTVSLYHWLIEHFDFDADLQAELDEFAEGEGADMSWLALSEAFADHLHGNGRLECPPEVRNTCNFDTDLSQGFQYTTLALEGDGCEGYPTHLIVNVHGGCDVRGGYASPKVLKLSSDEIYQAFDAARCSYLCAGGEGWHVQDSGWRDIERNDQNETSISDPLKLPEIGLDVDTWPEILEAKEGANLADALRALQNCQTLRKDIGAGTASLNGLDKDKSMEALRVRVEELDAEVIQLAGLVVCDLHTEGLFVHEHKLYLVSPDHPDQLVTEVNAYNN